MNKMLKTLAGRSFAASRMRNLIAALAIGLTALLFASVTTMTVGAMQSMNLTMQMQKGSRSDGDFRNMNREQFEQLQAVDWIREAGLRMPVSFLENAKRHNVEFDVLDEVQAELTFCMPQYGSVPEAADEVVASDQAIRALGAEPEIGAQIVIAFTVHGKAYELPMKVSGYYETSNSQLSVMWTGTAFRDAYPDIFRYTYDRDGEMAGTYYSDIMVKSADGLKERMEELSRTLGGNPDDMKAANYLPAVVNRMTNPAPDAGVIVITVLFAALFMFCGYLLIYNVFDIAVMQEIRRYGLYRTIGMGGRHVRKLLNCQVLWLSALGIPIGLLFGYVTGRTALPYIMEIFADEYHTLLVSVTPSPLIFAAAALLTVLTVWVSTRKPVKKAVEIPPIEAFRYVEKSTGRRSARKSAFGASLARLAWSNLGRNKRRSAFILISLSLCMILLNCAGIIADSVDVEKQASWMIRTDFAVVNLVSTNNMEGFKRREEALKKETIADIAAQPGVREGTAIYKNTMDDTDVTYSFSHVEALLAEPHDESGIGSNMIETPEADSLSILWDENGIVFGLGEDKRPICNVYGMEEAALTRMDLREGECDAHTLYQKMENGEGVLVGVPLNRNDMTYYEVFDLTEIGETISVYKDGQLIKELPVLAKAGINGDDEEIGFTCAGPLRVGHDGLFLYLPAGVYQEIYDDPVIYKYSFNMEEDKRADMETWLADYMENVDVSIDYLSAQSARESAFAMRRMIRFVGGLIGVIFGFAGVLNLVNMVITTILTRRHEFATMQSIGMTQRQLTKMMVLESLYYAAGACILGMTGAVILAFTLVRGIVQTQWFLSFRFTLLPAAAVMPVLFVTAFIVPVAALRTFYHDSIVEQLRIAG